MIDNSKLFTILTNAGIIIAGLILFAKSVKSLLTGKKLNGLALLFLALGILICAYTTYSQISGLNYLLPELASKAILLLESLFLALGSILLIMEIT